MALTTAEWRAIHWYMAEQNLKIRDLMAGPMVRSRGTDDKIIDVNIVNIKDKYRDRARSKKKKVGA